MSISNGVISSVTNKYLLSGLTEYEHQIKASIKKKTDAKMNAGQRADSRHAQPARLTGELTEQKNQTVQVSQSLARRAQ